MQLRVVKIRPITSYRIQNIYFEYNIDVRLYKKDPIGNRVVRNFQELRNGSHLIAIASCDD